METEEFIGKAKAFFTRQFDGVIRIEIIDGDGAVWVDGRADPPAVSATSPTGLDRRFCLWRIELPDVPLVLAPEKRRIESSFISGRLRISGDMAVMARLETVHD